MANRRALGWIAFGCVLGVACGSGGDGSDGDGSGGSSSGGAATGGAATGGAATGGAENDSGGSTSAGGSTSSGGDGSIAGAAGAGGQGDGGQGDGGSGGSDAACTADERRCDEQQPQTCDAGVWVDDGAPCELPELCHEDTGTCAVASILLPGGTFLRSYDTNPDTYTDDTAPATVSSVLLDEYEVTVGQFRRFGDAVLSGWAPAAGSGKHAHLNDGDGLSNSGPSEGHEGGWDVAWNTELPSNETDWNEAYACMDDATWTDDPGENELHPINCVNWYDAYAYCIWSGGFLPSEAEWNYAATGGDEQRMYAWGNATPSSTLAVFNVSGPAVVGSKPAGRGRWGHADLTGNLFEFTLDWEADYATPCSDCAWLEPGTPANRVTRGGNYNNIGHGSLRTGHRQAITPDWRVAGNGIRCARAPE